MAGRAHSGDRDSEEFNPDAFMDNDGRVSDYEEMHRQVHALFDARKFSEAAAFSIGQLERVEDPKERLMHFILLAAAGSGETDPNLALQHLRAAEQALPSENAEIYLASIKSGKVRPLLAIDDVIGAKKAVREAREAYHVAKAGEELEALSELERGSILELAPSSIIDAQRQVLQHLINAKDWPSLMAEAKFSLLNPISNEEEALAYQALANCAGAEENREALSEYLTNGEQAAVEGEDYRTAVIMACGLAVLAIDQLNGEAAVGAFQRAAEYIRRFSLIPGAREVQVVKLTEKVSSVHALLETHGLLPES